VSRRADGAAGGPGEAGRALRLAVLGNAALIGGGVLAVTSHLPNGGPGVRLLFGAYLGFLARRVPYLVRAAPAIRSGTDIR
jgi:hypothetical protein